MGLAIFLEIKFLEAVVKRVYHLLETLQDRLLLSRVLGKNYVKMHDVIHQMAMAVSFTA